MLSVSVFVAPRSVTKFRGGGNTNCELFEILNLSEYVIYMKKNVSDSFNLLAGWMAWFEKLPRPNEKCQLATFRVIS